MTNEEILANAPEGATHFDGNTYFRFEMYEHGQAYLVLKNGVWGRGLPAYPVYGCRSLSDIRRIVELESELDKAYNDLANFEGYPEEVSALRRDIERRKQRYLNLLNKRKEWKKRAEAAERERDYHVITIEVFRDWFTALRDHHVSNFAGPATKAFIGNLEVHLYWYTISDLLSGGGELDVTSNKFAIEQRISGIQRVLDCRELNLSEGDVATISLMQEQLRQKLNGGE